MFCPGTELQARPVFRTLDSFRACPQPVKHPAGSTRFLSVSLKLHLSLPICQQDSYFRSERFVIRGKKENTLIASFCEPTLPQYP